MKELIKRVRNKIRGDRRYYFNDFSKITPGERTINSPIMQFYSSNNNIGNYTPVIGIQEMLNHTTDTWCAHDKNIDFDFINKNYKSIIIGGAGLLHQSFENFWKELLEHSKLPMIIWGVGVCLPDKYGTRTDLKASTERDGVSPQIIAEVAKKCALINVRDNLTANYYNLENVNISACPTIVYLEKFKKSLNPKYDILLSSHKELVSIKQQEEIEDIISKSTLNYIYTDNIQTYEYGIEDIILKKYCKSHLVVTSRLHGAIIAYGLGIPYIAIARDKKVVDFVNIYGNGVLIDDIQDLSSEIEKSRTNKLINSQIQIDAVKEFGEKAKNWLAS